MTIGEVAATVAATAARVVVTGPARLHLGFFDPSGSLGRSFGGIGVVINGPQTEVELGFKPIGRSRHSRIDAAIDAGADLCYERNAADARHALLRARAYLEQLQISTARREPLELKLHSALPAHAGLGSGTQLALAVGRAFMELHGLRRTSSELAALLGRGQRSGVGIAGFEHGGVIVDGGPSSAQRAAPILARFEFPAAWRVLLVIDPASSGLHGDAERAALANLPSFPRTAAAHLCHLILMRVMPALAEADFSPFATGITELQQTIGAHFAPAQGGDIYTSSAVARLLRWTQSVACAAVGQSSWGPTGFAILPCQAEAEELVRRARLAGVVDPRLQLQIVTGRNLGARVRWPAAVIDARH